MDGKTVVIGVLVVSAVLLGGVVVSGLRQDAYAQGGVYATYLAVAASVQDQYVHYVVLDTEARRMLFYQVNMGKADNPQCPIRRRLRHQAVNGSCR